MVVKYGLKRLDDFTGPVHLRGDHKGVVLEDSEYPPLDESDEEDDWDFHDSDPNYDVWAAHEMLMHNERYEEIEYVHPQLHFHL
jgi:hypothetical protein